MDSFGGNEASVATFYSGVDKEVDLLHWQGRGEIQNTGETTEHGKRRISVQEMAKEF